MSSTDTLRCSPKYMDKPNVFSALSISRVIFAFLALVMTLIIGLIGIKQMAKLDKLHKALRYLFYISIIASSIRCLSAIIGELLCVWLGLGSPTISIEIVTLCGYYVLILTTLATILIRLQSTFEHSVYALSKCNKIIFIILFTLILISFIAALVLYSSITFIHAENRVYEIAERVTLTLIASIIAMLLYIITAIYAVILFTKKLLMLTELQTTSITNVDDIKLNESQHKMVNRIARYNALFSLATFTSICSIIVMFLGTIITNYYVIGHWWVTTLQIISIIKSIDCVINVICLYLQYSFATKYYRIYCKYLDKCWKQIFVNRTTKSLKYQYSRPMENISGHHTKTNTSKITRSIKSHSESESDDDSTTYH